jgi:hypothetical protein
MTAERRSPDVTENGGGMVQSVRLTGMCTPSCQTALLSGDAPQSDDGYAAYKADVVYHAAFLRRCVWSNLGLLRKSGLRLIQRVIVRLELSTPAR